MARYDSDMSNPVKGSGITTEHAAGVIVVGALVFLVLIRRGFRPSVHVSA